MSAQKPSIPKGTRDSGPAEVQKRRYILNTIETVFKKYGFMPIETPAMENLSTLEGKYGNEGDQLLFRILNSGDYLKELPAHDDKLSATKDAPGKLSGMDYKTALPFIAEKGLRYDLTVPFARYVVMNRNSISFPFRRYQMQPVWRSDRPQKGRYREFWQCDADVIGSDSLLNEADLVAIYAEVFSQLAIPVTIRINNRKFFDALIQKINKTHLLSEIVTAIDKMDKIGINGVMDELGKLGLTGPESAQVALFLQIRINPSDDDLKALQDLIGDTAAGEKGLAEVTTLMNALDAFGVKNQVTLDLTLARGLSYYTGCIFEVAAAAGTLKSSIGGGGRYDNLTGVFGLPNVSGVGISLGLDRIYDVMEELSLFPLEIRASSTRLLFCCFDENAQQFALTCLKQCRDAGIPAEIYPDLKKIGKQLDHANALRIPYAAIIGENELQNRKIVLKDLNAGTQEDLTPEAIITRLGINDPPELLADHYARIIGSRGGGSRTIGCHSTPSEGG